MIFRCDPIKNDTIRIWLKYLDLYAVKNDIYKICYLKYVSNVCKILVILLTLIYPLVKSFLFELLINYLNCRK